MGGKSCVSKSFPHWCGEGSCPGTKADYGVTVALYEVVLRKSHTCLVCKVLYEVVQVHNSVVIWSNLFPCLYRSEPMCHGLRVSLVLCN